MLIGHFCADEIDIDVIAHVFDDFFLGVSFPLIGIQIELADDLQQFGAGKDLLIEALDALIRKAGHRGADEFRGDLLLFDENRGLGFIDRGQEQGHHGGNHHDREGRPDKIMLSGEQRPPIIA